MPDLLEVLKRKLDPPHADTSDLPELLHRHGNPLAALLYSILFLPDLVEIEGSVLLKLQLAGVEERFRAAIRDRDRPRAEIEASFNWVEIPYLFAPAVRRQTDDNDDALLAELVAEAWRGRLAQRFPGRTFVVSVRSPKETGSVVGVGFHERR